MNDRSGLDSGLRALSASLGAHPGLAERVMKEVRQAAPSDEDAPRPAPRVARHGRRLFAAAVFAATSAAALIAMVSGPVSKIAWADVTRAIQSQKWIRGTVTDAQGRRGTMWLSPDHRIWGLPA